MTHSTMLPTIVRRGASFERPPLVIKTGVTVGGTEPACSRGFVYQIRHVLHCIEERI